MAFVQDYAVELFFGGFASMCVCCFLMIERNLLGAGRHCRNLDDGLRAEVRQARENHAANLAAFIASLHDAEPANRRAGISLTEVLLAMFVVTVGILGLAALIPVGGSYLRTAQTDDRSSNLGRAAFHDVQVRGYLDQNLWLDHTGDKPANWLDYDFPNPDGTPGTLVGSPIGWGNVVCIDPLMVAAANGTNPRVATFPYTLDNDPDADGDPVAVPNPPRMTRCTLRTWENQPTPVNLATSRVLFERIFRGSDDLTFGFPENEPDARPFAALGSAKQVRQFTGEYSWFFTVCPMINEQTLQTDNHGGPQTYNVSVVVTRNRVLDVSPYDLSGTPPDERNGTPPTERTVYCDFISGVGLGGGDVRLGLPILDPAAPNADANLPKLSDFPEVKPGQWILLSGWLSDGLNPITPMFRWYRVSSAGPLKHESPADFPANIAATRPTNPEWCQYVTLVGPDWWSSNGVNQFIDADNSPNVGGSPHTCHAILVDGVVNVYEKTMRLDTRAFGVR